jgi:hypothetical protein
MKAIVRRTHVLYLEGGEIPVEVAKLEVCGSASRGFMAVSSQAHSCSASKRLR